MTDVMPPADTAPDPQRNRDDENHDRRGPDVEIPEFVTELFDAPSPFHLYTAQLPLGIANVDFNRLLLVQYRLFQQFLVAFID